MWSFLVAFLKSMFNILYVDVSQCLIFYLYSNKNIYNISYLLYNLDI